MALTKLYEISYINRTILVKIGLVFGVQKSKPSLKILKQSFFMRHICVIVLYRYVWILTFIKMPQYQN